MSPACSFLASLSMDRLTLPLKPPRATKDTMERITHRTKTADCRGALVIWRAMKCLCSTSCLKRDLAVMQGDDPVGPSGDLRVVGDEQHGDPALLVKLQEQIQDGLAVARIQVAGGLVRKDDARTVDQGPTDGNPLL